MNICLQFHEFEIVGLALGGVELGDVAARGQGRGVEAVGGFHRKHLLALHREKSDGSHCAGIAVAINHMYYAAGGVGGEGEGGGLPGGKHNTLCASIGVSVGKIDRSEPRSPLAGVRSVAEGAALGSDVGAVGGVGVQPREVAGLLRGDLHHAFLRRRFTLSHSELEHRLRADGVPSEPRQV